MMIIPQNCIEQGLLPPKSYDSQLSYIKRNITAGYVINTHICRYIGIGNLHSYAPILRAEELNFSEGKQRAYCPARKIILSRPVLHIYMTEEQQSQYWAEKKPELA